MQEQLSNNIQNNNKQLVGIIAPDSFKGTLSSTSAARSISAGFRSIFPNLKIIELPMADGGEGSSEILGHMLNAKRIEVDSFDPLARKHKAFFFLDEKQRAYIELAAASGITLLSPNSDTSRRATTFGTGCIIKSAITSGAKEIFLFLGGSATTDGGVGMAKALGYRFFDNQGELMPSAEHSAYVGEHLDQVCSIDSSGALALLDGVSIVGIVDVDNPLCGDHGAAAVYGPQKGALPNDVAYLDLGLGNLASVVKRDLNTEIDYSNMPGAGAAGGSGFAVMSFMRGSIRSGPKFFLDTLEFDNAYASSDFVVTGEGCVDSQSMKGKLLGELLKRTLGKNKPLISLAGCVSLQIEDLRKYPHFSAFGLGHNCGFSHTEEALELLAFQVASLLSRNIRE